MPAVQCFITAHPVWVIDEENSFVDILARAAGQESVVSLVRVESKSVLLWFPVYVSSSPGEGANGVFEI